MVSAEDSQEILAARLREIIKAMGLNTHEIQIVLDSVFIWDVSGQSMRLISQDKMIDLSDLPDQIIDAYQEAGLDLITFDPAISFGACEQAINDNEQGLILAARRIYKALNCCVRYVHHVSQGVARSKITDQYAGRGGTAMADGSRMVAVLTRCDEKDLSEAPPACTIGDGESVLMLDLPKLSYSKPIPSPNIA